MKIGLLAFSSNTGLGYQTREFYKYIKPDKVLIADISKLNNMPVDHFWCKTNCLISDGIPTNEQCEWLVNDMDVVFFAETPLNYHLIEYANNKSVKTILHANPEFMDYWDKKYLPKPSLIALPSPWKKKEIEKLNIAPVKVLRVPVDTEKFLFKRRSNAKKFIHIVGRPTAEDRNGTLSFLEAIKEIGIDKNYKFVVCYQTPQEERNKIYFKPILKSIYETKEKLKKNLLIKIDVKDNKEIYKYGDVLVLPRAYGGLCLPVNEALACGMPVIMTNIEPNYSILPSKWLVEALIEKSFKTHTEITIYRPDIDDLIAKMKLMKKNSLTKSKLAYKLAQELSWNNQYINYIETFKEICGL